MADDTPIPGLTHSKASALLNAAMYKKGEWCGVPMPLKGMRLDIESKNPWREGLEQFQNTYGKEELGPDEGPDSMPIVNSWFSAAQNCRVGIVDHDGRRRVIRYAHRNGQRVNQLMMTLGAYEAWEPDTELRAMEALEAIVKPHIFAQYLLTGMFLETSPRSKLTYVFRKLAPTLVITPHRHNDGLSILCALCLHPIAYYRHSHAGAMVPTDDVIAHLLMMRADEPLLWRRANQHSPHSPEAALF